MVVKQIDKASGGLVIASIAGTVLPVAILTGSRGSADAPAVETVTFSAGSIEFRYTPVAPDGRPRPDVTALIPCVAGPAAP